MITTFTPETAAVEAARLRAGGIPRSEADARALRSVLAAGRPSFKPTEDVLQDLDILIKSEAAAPAPAAVTPPPVYAPRVPASTAPTPSTKHAPRVVTPAPNPLLAEYQAVANDPVLLARFLADNPKGVGRLIQDLERAPAVRAHDADDEEAGGGDVQSKVSPDRIEAEYSKVKDHPKKLARFLEANAQAVKMYLFTVNA